MNWFERLKKRWEVKNNFQVLIIFVVFGITGSSTAYLTKPLYSWLGLGDLTTWWWKVILFIVIGLPLYQVLLLLWGTLFGQFNFFWNFEKRTLGRLFIRKQKEGSDKEFPGSNS